MTVWIVVFHERANGEDQIIEVCATEELADLIAKATADRDQYTHTVLVEKWEVRT